MARRSSNETQNEIPLEEGQPVVGAATRAHFENRRIFTCAVTVEYSSGGGVGFGGKKTTILKTWDPSTLIEQIESSG